MTLQRYKIILNPVAGKGKAEESITVIENLLKARGLSYRLFLTKGVWHAAELARDAKSEGFNVVVSAGGDGTANEVINGLMLAQAKGDSIPAMGLLSIGRGNDFSYGADVPSDLVSCVDVLVRDQRRAMDVGRVSGGDYPQGRYFGNGIGIGFDTIVGLEAAKMKYVQGFMAYVFGALKTLVMYPNAPEISIAYDGGVFQQPSHQVSIMNGKRMGGTFFMAPDARNYDGLLDLCLAYRLTRRDMISLIGHYIKGTQAKHPLIKTARSSRYEIKAPNGGLVVHADGETICTNGTSLLVECLASKIQIVCNAGAEGVSGAQRN